MINVHIDVLRRDLTFFERSKNPDRKEPALRTLQAAILLLLGTRTAIYRAVRVLPCYRAGKMLNLVDQKALE